MVIPPPAVCSASPGPTDGTTRPGSSPGRAHLVGVCGSGMKALAELLTGAGWQVTGSDRQATETTRIDLARRGLRVHGGHAARHVPAESDVVVYSPAVPADNPERQRARQMGIPELSYSRMLGQLMQGRQGVCVAGTHGKSTTTAMTGCILTEAELSPSVVVGAELCQFGRSGWSGAGPLFVVESCEFQRSFLDLHPHWAAILGIEPDHFDCYAHFDETIAAFAQFAQRVPADGGLLIPADCEVSQAACLAASAPVRTFGLDSDADWCARDVRPAGAGVRFRVFCAQEYFSEIRLQVPGRHNVLNALAAAALAHAAGAPVEAIRAGLAEFPGLRRRFETVGTWRGATLIDDYAHHPTAVLATLATARRRFPGRTIRCAFQPHQVSRTRALLAEFAASLTCADDVLVVPVFAAREALRGPEPRETSEELARRITAAGGRGRFLCDLDRAAATLDDDLRPGDVLITMGAGDIGLVHHEFTRRLQRHHAS